MCTRIRLDTRSTTTAQLPAGDGFRISRQNVFGPSPPPRARPRATEAFGRWRTLLAVRAVGRGRPPTHGEPFQSRVVRSLHTINSRLVCEAVNATDTVSCRTRKLQAATVYCTPYVEAHPVKSGAPHGCAVAPHSAQAQAHSALDLSRSAERLQPPTLTRLDLT